MVAIHCRGRIPPTAGGSRSANRRRARISYLRWGRLFFQEEEQDACARKHGSPDGNRPVRDPDFDRPFDHPTTGGRFSLDDAESRPSAAFHFTGTQRMSQVLFLVKYGEIALKKRNRGAFVRRLKESIYAKLPELSFEVYETFHRVFVKCDRAHRESMAAALQRTFGIVSFCEAERLTCPR
jgi:hypothetical protein